MGGGGGIIWVHAFARNLGKGQINCTKRKKKNKVVESDDGGYMELFLYKSSQS